MLRIWKHKRILFACLLMGCVLAESLFAQSTEVVVRLMPVENRTSADSGVDEQFATRFGEIVGEVLQNELDASDIIVLSPLPDDAPDSSVTVRIGGYYYIQSESFTLTIQAIDDASKRIIEAATIDGQIDVTLQARVSKALSKIVPVIARATAVDINREEMPRPFTTGIQIVSAVEGAQIFYHAQTEESGRRYAVVQTPDGPRAIYYDQAGIFLGTIENGQLSVPYMPFATGENVSIEQRHEDFYTHPQDIVIDDTAPISLVPPPQKHDIGIVSWWTFGQAQGAGLGLRWYVIPDMFFVGIDNYLYLQSYQSGLNSIIHNDVRAMVGLYVLFPPTSPFRVGLSTGFGTIITSLLDSTYVDLYVSLVDAWAQIEIVDPLAFFVRGELKWSLANDGGLLGEGRVNSGLGDLLEVDFLSVASISMGLELRF